MFRDILKKPQEEIKSIVSELPIEALWMWHKELKEKKMKWEFRQKQKLFDAELNITPDGDHAIVKIPIEKDEMLFHIDGHVIDLLKLEQQLSNMLKPYREKFIPVPKEQDGNELVG